MSFVPFAIEPPRFWFSMKDLKWPEDRKTIARLSLEGKQIWYAAQDPIKLIESDSDFHSFWFRNYILPLKIKRFLYILKFW